MFALHPCPGVKSHVACPVALAWNQQPDLGHTLSVDKSAHKAIYHN